MNRLDSVEQCERIGKGERVRLDQRKEAFDRELVPAAPASPEPVFDALEAARPSIMRDPFSLARRPEGS